MKIWPTRSVTLIKRLLVVAILLTLPKIGNAQTLTIESDQWSLGTVTLVSGGLLSGLVYFDEKTQTVVFKDDAELRALKASKVVKFDFYDSTELKKRSFISLPFSKTENTREVLEFLEILRDYADFLILSRLSHRTEVLPRNK